MTKIQEISIPEYEKVIEIIDPDVGLHAFIVIHNSALGPALGGLRIFPYENRDEALIDVLRLAQGMSYKSALAGLKFGGGKSVIIADPKKIDKKPLLLAFADAINSLHGQYIVAEDMGSTPQDMEIIQSKSPHVAALCQEASSGDPSRFTAWGVFRGIQAATETIWGSHSLHGKVIALQGLGSVGEKVAKDLFWHGARLIVADVDEQKVEAMAELYGAKIVDTNAIYSVECDIFCPCARGGILNDETIPLLRCKAVAGGANNQLLHSKNGWDLMKRGILYVPDFIINAGGVINAASEFDPQGYDPQATRDKVDHIGVILRAIFVLAAMQDRPPNELAYELASQKLALVQHQHSGG